MMKQPSLDKLTDALRWVSYGLILAAPVVFLRECHHSNRCEGERGGVWVAGKCLRKDVVLP